MQDYSFSTYSQYIYYKILQQPIHMLIYKYSLSCDLIDNFSSGIPWELLPVVDPSFLALANVQLATHIQIEIGFYPGVSCCSIFF